MESKKKANIVIVKKYIEAKDAITPSGGVIGIKELKEFISNVSKEEMNELGREAEIELERLGIEI